MARVTFRHRQMAFVAITGLKPERPKSVRWVESGVDDDVWLPNTAREFRDVAQAIADAEERGIKTQEQPRP